MKEKGWLLKEQEKGNQGQSEVLNRMISVSNVMQGVIGIIQLKYILLPYLI
jgi:hypothetical protein